MMTSSRSAIFALILVAVCLLGGAEAFGKRAREAERLAAEAAAEAESLFSKENLKKNGATIVMGIAAIAAVAGIMFPSKKKEMVKTVQAPKGTGGTDKYMHEYNTSEQKVLASFPFAMTNAELVRTIQAALKPYGYGKNSLLATSLCCDEVNRVLDDDLSEVFGDNFSMGGLAGFSFGGVTSFGAMAHHIPEGGSCLIVYGPHVGVDAEGNVGKINRRGRPVPGPCCGSAAAACTFCTTDGAKAPSASPDPIDAQQSFVTSQLLPYANRLKAASNVNIELPKSLFDAQQKLMDRIVAAGCGEVHSPGNIALLGGIQINTPAGTSDYFLPLSFELRDNKNNTLRKFI